MYRLNLEKSPRSYLEFLVVVVMASTSRNRDIGRSYESGHEKRKKKALEEEKQRKDVASMPKITDLFCRPKPPSTHVEVEPTALVSEPNVSVEEEPEPPRPQSPSKSNHCLTDGQLLHGQLLRTNSERHLSQPTIYRLPTLVSLIQHTFMMMGERGT
jgi:hypothetical protein